MAQRPRDALHFSPDQAQHFDRYLPSPARPGSLTHVTLTFATSLDSQLSLAPGVQTALSGPESKAMTHYLRSKHDAILIGVGTAVADNPSLNCRIEGVGGYGGRGLEGQPRPVVVDPSGRWEFSTESKVLKLAADGKGKAPWIVTRTGSINTERKLLMQRLGGRIVEFDAPGSSIPWPKVLNELSSMGINSVMIEGGGGVINDLLSVEIARENSGVGLVTSVIVTIAPVWLGKGGVQVCPDARIEEGQKLPVSRLMNVKWLPLGEDVVLCGHPDV